MFILCLLILASSTGFAQVRGNGNVVEQERSVGPFTAVSVSGGIDLSLQQGEQPALTIVSDENLQEYIISEVEGGTLKIYIKKNTNIQHRTQLLARVTVSELNKVSVSGGGDVESLNRINAEDLSISISGGGDLDFELGAGRVICSMSGGGDVDMEGSIREFKATLSGGGDLELDGDIGTLDLNMSGGGDASVSSTGTGSSVIISMSGGGDLNLDMACEKIKVTVSGGGDVTIDAGDNTSQASVNVSGGGDLDMDIKAVECAVDVSGGGDALLNGSAQKFSGNIRSGGDLNAGDFTIQAAVIELSGGSEANIHVEKELKLSSSGGGDVYLSGDPHVDANLTGGSEIHRK